MAITRTFGPLHFEDLDPKRFEDLVRQLAYDFKQWRRLEATGRAGSDDGFDARGYEIIHEAQIVESDDEETLQTNNDRLWLIQCKRERKIHPAKLEKYLDDIHLFDGERLYGIVFTAACDFSKRARDLFRQRCEILGIEEWHLWGKAELEDLLFQPRNDALLFVYFGISLTIRQRSQKAELRAKLAIKRKAHRLLGERHHNPILLRSPDAFQYPVSSEIENFKDRPLWILRGYRGLCHSGLLFCIRRHFAYLDDECKQWDAAFIQNDGFPHDDPWNENPNDSKVRQEIYETWSKLPRHNQAWFELHAIVPFESILDIDDLGDEFIDAPHIFVPFNGPDGPFVSFRAMVESADTYSGRTLSPKSRNDGRISIFIEEWRNESGKELSNEISDIPA